MEQYATEAGWVGMAIILFAYYLNATHRMSSRQKKYHALNILGSVLIGYSVYHEGVWSSFALQIAWGAIALVQFTKLLRRR